MPVNTFLRALCAAKQAKLKKSSNKPFYSFLIIEKYKSRINPQQAIIKF